MFRKLFLSLLILSALTSEGFAKLPDNIYNYLNLDYVFDLIDGEEILTERQQDTEVKPGVFYAVLNESLRSISLESFQFPEGRNTECFFHLSGIGSDGLVSCSAEILTLDKSEKDCILKKSDISPPYFA